MREQANITITIERLVIEGVPLTQRQRPRVQAALETELVQLITAGGLTDHLCSGGTYTRLRANGIQLQDDIDAEELGKQIARAVYGGMCHE